MKEIKAELTSKEVLLKENYSEEEWNKLREKYLNLYNSLINLLEDPVRKHLTYMNYDGEDEDVEEKLWESCHRDSNSLYEMFNFFTSIQDEDVKIINVDPVYIDIRNRFLLYIGSAVLQYCGVKGLIIDIEDKTGKHIGDFSEEELHDYLDDFFLDIEEKEIKYKNIVLSFIKDVCNYDTDLVISKILFYTIYVNKEELFDYIIDAYEGQGRNWLRKDPYSGRDMIYESIFPLLSRESTSLKTYLHRYMDVQEVEEGEFRINWRIQKKNKN